MRRALAVLCLAAPILAIGACASQEKEEPTMAEPTKPDFETDVFQTTAGELTISFLGHGTLMFEIGSTVVHVDPVSAEADFAKLPKADLVLVTHEHFDHLDKDAIAAIRKPDTALVCSKSCASEVDGAVFLSNGENAEEKGVKIEAVPAYNIEHHRPDGQPFHPKGRGNGYVLTFGDLRVYVAGDTENIPEMKDLEDVDVAFLPMNLPYTMTPDMVAGAARIIRPRILYPYHYGDTDPSKLVERLKGEKDIEVRIRNLR